MDLRMETRMQIVELIEQTYKIEIQDQDKLKIHSLLNQMHGISFKQGLKEGTKVLERFKSLKEKKETNQ